MAAIFSRDVVGSKFVLDVALATPAAILNLRLARANFAHSRHESSFETASCYRALAFARSAALLMAWTAIDASRYESPPPGHF